MRTLVCQREGQSGFEFLIRQCPNCGNQTSEEPICAFFEGFIDQAVKDFSYGENFKVTETECLAAGAPNCKFLITESGPTATSIMNLAVIIPTYNEKENLPLITAQLMNLPLQGLRLLIIDDNSPDGTGHIADELCTTISRPD